MVSFRKKRRRVDALPKPAKWIPPLDPGLNAARLLEQQFWCLGRDVGLPRQNLLVRYGLERHAPLNPGAKTSCYAQRTRTGVMLALWGFGAYFADPQQGAILLSRWAICPTVREVPCWPVQASAPEELDMRLALPSDAAWVQPLLTRLVRWFSQYEEYVLNTEGASYLERSLEECPRPIMPRSEMRQRWLDVVAALEETSDAKSYSLPEFAAS